MPNLDHDARPGLAIVTNSVTPYHVNLERLIADGIPELKLHVLITHGISDFNWDVNIPPQIHLERFGAPGEHPEENPLRRPIWDWRKGARMIRHFRENNIRAAIFNGYRFISYLRLMQYCYHSQIPFFVNTDGNIRTERKLSVIERTAKKSIYAWWMKRVSGVFSMGASGDEFFIKYGADPARLYRVPYWPDYDAFISADPGSLERFRQKFRLDSQRRRLIFSGRLVPVKRVDLLIDAFSALADERPEWDLLIVGDGVLRDALQRRVPAALQKRVVWTGFLEVEELVLAYHTADVLVLPSDHEPWALVVQEAMAAGLTVVASDIVAAAREMVVDGVSGRIFPRGDVDSLRKALQDVTQRDRIDVYRQNAAVGLADYRARVYPVREVRRALFDAGVLTQ